jgi:nucleoside 2-deoxyribosyltransferase
MYKIYVAGKWGDRKDIKKNITYLNSLGFEVVSKWVDREHNIHPEDYAQCSKLDIDEVSECDKLLAIMTDPEYPYRGTNAEIGCALGLKKPVVILCDGVSKKINETQYSFSHFCMKNIFYWHPTITHVNNLDDAIKELIKKI